MLELHWNSNLRWGWHLWWCIVPPWTSCYGKIRLMKKWVPKSWQSASGGAVFFTRPKFGQAFRCVDVSLGSGGQVWTSMTVQGIAGVRCSGCQLESNLFGADSNFFGVKFHWCSCSFFWWISSYWVGSYPFLGDFLQVPIGSTSSTRSTCLFLPVLTAQGDLSYLQSIAGGAKGSVRADTKIYFDEFSWWRSAPNNNQDIPGTCPTSLLYFGTWKQVDIRVDIHFSSCFIMFHNVERWWWEERRLCPVARAACAEHKWHMIGSAESKRSSSTFLGKRQSYDFMSGWRVYNIWVQKDLHQSLYM